MLRRPARTEPRVAGTEHQRASSLAEPSPTEPTEARRRSLLLLRQHPRAAAIYFGVVSRAATARRAAFINGDSARAFFQIPLQQLPVVGAPAAVLLGAIIRGNADVRKAELDETPRCRCRGNHQQTRPSTPRTPAPAWPEA